MSSVPNRLVIRRARLVRDPPATGATVVVVGDRIARVAAPGEIVPPEPGDWEIDAAGRLLVPGLVDAHTHLALGALLRFAGIPPRYPGSPRALRQGFRRPVEERLAPADVEALAAASALAALRAGTTTVFALERAAPGAEVETLEAAARAVGAVGIRALLAHGASDLGGSDRGRASARAALAFGVPRERDPLVRGMAGLEGLSATTRETLDALAEPAARLGTRLGVVEAGAAADLALLEWRPSAVEPEGRGGNAAVLWAGAPAAWVIVAGEVRLREGVPLGVDPDEVSARAVLAARRALAD
jgi:cytosine/adenosine deaminase-related metal-dependent hydrolase